MEHRKGTGVVTTILVAVIAVLGTTVFFLVSGNQLIGELPESESGNSNQAPQQSQPPTAEETVQVPIMGQESIRLSNSHIWVATNNTSTAAFAIQNTGSAQVTITSIVIRGLSIPLTSVYYNTVDATSSNINTELIADYTEYTVDVDSDPAEETFTQAAGPITLSQGQAAILYIDDPANIDAIDAGLAMTLNVQAGQASAVQSALVVSQN